MSKSSHADIWQRVVVGIRTLDDLSRWEIIEALSILKKNLPKSIDWYYPYGQPAQRLDV